MTSCMPSNSDEKWELFLSIVVSTLVFAVLCIAVLSLIDMILSVLGRN